jgi:membrane associated rhomboid family serine protease
MRDPSPRTPPSVLACFLGLLVGGFVLQQIFRVWGNGSTAPIEYGALSGTGIRSGQVWTLLTYVLLHGGIGHLLMNGLGLFFIGRELQTRLGPQRFLQLILTGSIGAGLVWLGVHLGKAGNVIGASGVLMAFLAVFACHDPRRPIQLLLFFVLPVTVQPIWVVGVLGSIDLLGFLFYELPKNQTLYGNNVAHSAHLGGLAAGWLFYKITVARGSGSFGRGPVIEPPAWFRRKNSRPAVTSRVNLDPRGSTSSSSAAPASAPAARRDALRAEVDRILDKINLHGFGSLTAAEKRVLDEARNHLNPR